MNRRGFLLALAGAAAGGAALSAQAQAAPATALWDELQAMEAGSEDIPAEGAEETQGRHRGHYKGRRPAVRYYGRPRGRAYGYYRRPHRRYRRRVCRLVRSRYGYPVRRCFWVW
ncbi:MAG: hypothetical protein K2Y29_12620 [Beijerinckiaceae bacterium]|nr:hypothetical protein [Beijerinckiaceae bacterium]